MKLATIPYALQRTVPDTSFRPNAPAISGVFLFFGDFISEFK